MSIDPGWKAVDDAERDKRQAERERKAAAIFDRYGKPASSYRKGQLVGTRDGLTWRIVGSSFNGKEIILEAVDADKMSAVKPGDLLVPGNAQHKRIYAQM